MASKIRIAINGFGRIGRLTYRVLHERNMLNEKVEVVAVNDLVPAENLAYLLKYDTVHGNLDTHVEALSNNKIKVGDYSFKAYDLKVSPNQLPWQETPVDIVIESTGLFTKRLDSMGHIEAGAKKVIISAPSDDDVKTILMGVNHDQYFGEDVISNASCTTNCLGPIVHVLQKEGIGLKEGLMLTAHAYTASQSLVDGASKRDFRTGRAAAQNLVPSSTGAAKAMGMVIPEVKGKLTGMSLRVPVVNVSMVDLTFKPERETSLEEINEVMQKASRTYLKGILNYINEPLVSSDFIHDSHSAIYDSTASIELNSGFFKLIAWYDNEWGYANRIVDLLALVSSKL